MQRKRMQKLQKHRANIFLSLIPFEFTLCFEFYKVDQNLVDERTNQLLT